MDSTSRDRLRELYLVACALIDSMNANVQPGQGDIWKYAGYKQYIRKYNQLLVAVSKITAIDAVLDAYDYSKIPDAGDAIGLQQQELFQSVHANLSVLKAYLENKLAMKQDEITNLVNFFKANLRRAVFDIPEKELDIQNAVEQLLIGRGLTKGVDYDRETGRVKVSIKECVPDFIFPKLGLALEVKLSKDRNRSRVIVDEINADIRAYGTKYSALVFIVYDLGSIRDEVEFKHGLELADSVSILVIKH
jgi:REase_DpnII-MboI